MRYARRSTKLKQFTRRGSKNVLKSYASSLVSGYFLQFVQLTRVPISKNLRICVKTCAFASKTRALDAGIDALNELIGTKTFAFA